MSQIFPMGAKVWILATRTLSIWSDKNAAHFRRSSSWSHNKAWESCLWQNVRYDLFFVYNDMPITFSRGSLGRDRFTPSDRYGKGLWFARITNELCRTVKQIINGFDLRDMLWAILCKQTRQNRRPMSHYGFLVIKVISPRMCYYVWANNESNYHDI